MVVSSSGMSISATFENETGMTLTHIRYEPRRQKDQTLLVLHFCLGGYIAVLDITVDEHGLDHPSTGLQRTPEAWAYFRVVYRK